MWTIQTNRTHLHHWHIKASHDLCGWIIKESNLFVMSFRYLLTTFGTATNCMLLSFNHPYVVFPFTWMGHWLVFINVCMYTSIYVCVGRASFISELCKLWWIHIEMITLLPFMPINSSAEKTKEERNMKTISFICIWSGKEESIKSKENRKNVGFVLFFKEKNRSMALGKLHF